MKSFSIIIHLSCFKGLFLYFTTFILTIPHTYAQNGSPVFYYAENREPGLVGNIASSASETFMLLNTGEAVPEYGPDFKLPDIFTVQSDGKILTKVPLDREKKPSFTLIVHGSMRSTAVSVTINILDENDNAPTFAQPTLEKRVPENTSPGDQLAVLGTATDNDLGDNSTQRYELVTGSPIFKLETIQIADNKQAILKLNQALDYEDTRSYSVRVRAFDGLGLYGDMVITVLVQDINDIIPQFDTSLYNIEVYENATIGTTLLTVHAEDDEEGAFGDVVYEISGENASPNYNYFSIDRITGEIKLQHEVNYNEQHQYRFRVIARNPSETLTSKSSIAIVNITIVNVNDKEPVITLHYIIGTEIPEDTAREAVLVRVSLTDPDEDNGNFSVELSDTGGTFSIQQQNRDTFFIKLQSKLDRETTPIYNITVTAWDTGVPPLNKSELVTLVITDINDNTPRFNQSSYTAEVDAGAAVGTPVKTVTARDADIGLNALITYSIVDVADPDTDGWFTVLNNTGMIQTAAERIDCEINDAPRLTLRASDNGSPSLHTDVSVTVNVKSVNDNQPVFDESFYSATISENLNINQQVLQVTATDSDCGINAEVMYSLDTQTDLPFSIDSTTGLITLKRRVDFETKKLYEFPVSASDRGRQTGTVNVKVSITDFNDNEPIFNPASYNANVQRSNPVGHQVIVVTAEDKDSGINGQITYSLSTGDQYFAINATSGMIYIGRRIPLSSPSNLNITVQATDGLGVISSVSATVNIRVAGDDYIPPVFQSSLYQFSIDENLINTRVGRVTATVQSSSSGVQYSIFSGDSRSNYFSIVRDTGEIRTTNNVIDRETVPYILLNVQSVKDNTYGSAQVNITINDVNDNDPEFSFDDPVLEIPEDQARNISFYTVQARDRDSGGNGRVRFSLITNPGHKFQINPITGELSVKTGLDFMEQSQYVLTVQATDGGNPQRSSQLSVTVKLKDINNHDPVCSQSEFILTLSELDNPLKIFGTVEADDLDTGQSGNIVYQIINQQDEFGIYPSTGEIYNKISFSQEERRTDITFSVRAADNGIPQRSATCNVRIKIRDENDNTPKFSQNIYEFTISESANTGNQVGRVSATDTDLGLNARIVFDLIGTTAFNVDRSNGWITVSGELDRETTDRYEFDITAADSGTRRSLTAECRVTVIISDVNDNSPLFEGLQSGIIPASIQEKKEPGTRVVQVTAVDDDLGEFGRVTYKIIPPTSGGSQFSIDAQNGWIRSEIEFDKSIQNQYNITVSAQDQASPPLTSRAVVSVTILDENEQRQFTASYLNLEVYENTAIGTRVGEVLSPADFTPGEVEFIVTQSSTNNVFDVNRTSGAVYPTLTIDYEQKQTHWLLVEARDAADNTQGTIINVTISILDVNDNMPEFENNPMWINVNENITIGTHVGQVIATDRDSGVNGRVVYEIVSQYPEIPSDLFNINPSTGWIRTAKQIDYENTTGLLLVVKTTDQPLNEAERLFRTMTVVINIEDINDNFPQFKSRNNISIAEDEPVGYPILLIAASDLDKNNSIRYTVVGGDPERKFTLNRDTGELSLASALDRETTAVYRLQVNATDTGNPPNQATQIIKITVTDVNDNPPAFLQKAYTADILETASIGTSVRQIRAEDRDSGNNSKLVYLIPSGLADNKFTVNNQGLITTRELLDRETNSQYVFSAYVKDSAFPARYDFCQITVNVLDYNDNSPYFMYSQYYQTVPENLRDRNTSIFQVLAQDRDTGINAQIRYSILSGNELSRFSIDENTGKIYAQSLDRELTERYTLTIQARDQGTPSRSNETRVIITVSDTNDNDPEFTQPLIYTKTIPETIDPGTPIINVTAHDRDKGNNSKISYFISNSTNGTDGKFVIDFDTGAISTSAVSGVFDREKRHFYRFEVTARDNAQYDPRTKQTWVEITISDVNDNAPVFSEAPFVVNISGTTAGRQVLQLRADDKDIGENGVIIYSLAEPNDDFQVERDGTVKIVKTFWQTVVNLKVRATDRGTPPLYSDGFVQINIGSSAGPQSFKFQNSSYSVYMDENVSQDQLVIKVKAVHTSGTGYSITYSLSGDLASVNNPFIIDSNDGSITVKYPAKIDYELITRYRIVVVAYSEQTSQQPLTDYCTVWVNIRDVNDHEPRFPTKKYSAVIGEQAPINTYIRQVIATDEDSGLNGDIEFRLQGDNAHFLHVGGRTGIVTLAQSVDRETNSFIRVTVIAQDKGNPSKTGTSILRLTVLDANDNSPTFTNLNQININNPIEIPEDHQVGGQVFVVSALDIDETSVVTFDFTPSGNPQHTFSIDHFTGRITLARPIDHEVRDSYRLEVIANDTLNVVSAHLYVNVTDENDNAPTFPQQSYAVTLEEQIPAGTKIFQVNATDLDSAENGLITYSMEGSGTDRFEVEALTGSIKTRVLIEYSEPTTQLAIRATDNGSPSLSALVFIQLHIMDVNNYAPHFTPDSAHNRTINEDEALGVTLFTVTATDQDDSELNKRVFYSIIAGDPRGVFSLDSNTGYVELKAPLDREVNSTYSLTIMAFDAGTPSRNSTIMIHINIKDANDHKPRFINTEPNRNSETPLIVCHIPEDAAEGAKIVTIQARDEDIGDNSKIDYMITSGNDNGLFTMNQTSGDIRLAPRKQLDFDTKQTHDLQIRAIDNGVPRQSALATLLVNVSDVNDNKPSFRSYIYLETVAESQAAGTYVFTAQAIDEDAGQYGVLTYQIVGDMTDFRVDPNTGEVTTGREFRHKIQKNYKFNVSATDGEFTAYVQVTVEVTSVDSYTPVFQTNLYSFTVDAATAEVGQIVGRVEATDQDDGADGVVLYKLAEPNYYFQVTSEDGTIIVRNKLTEDSTKINKRSLDYLHREKRQADDKIILRIMAWSGKPSSRSTEVKVEIGINGLPNTDSITTDSGGIPTTHLIIIIIVVSLVVIVLGIVIVVITMKRRQQTNKNHSRPTEMANTTLVPPPYGRAAGLITPINAQYSSFPSYIQSNHPDITDRSQCGASSGRGSADFDDEGDEEITAINHGPLHARDREKIMPDSGIQRDHDDCDSEHSAPTNHQEYLARLGIDTKNIGTKAGLSESVESMHHFDDEGGGEADPLDISNLYSKLGSTSDSTAAAQRSGESNINALGFGEAPASDSIGSLSSVTDASEEFAGSYNWDYLLDWGPQYQPLADVFAEIARLKDDTIQPKRQPVLTIPQTRNVVSQQPKLGGPPPIITATPPRVDSAGSNSRQNHGNLSSAQTSQLTSMVSLPHSPMSHESSFSNLAAFSPNFTPALSPLAMTRSPSVSTIQSGASSHRPTSSHGSKGHRHANITLREDIAEHEFRI